MSLPRCLKPAPRPPPGARAPAAHRLGAPLTPDALRGTPRRLRLLCPPASETKDPDEGDAWDDEDEGEPGHDALSQPPARRARARACRPPPGRAAHA